MPIPAIASGSLTKTTDTVIDAIRRQGSQLLE